MNQVTVKLAFFHLILFIVLILSALLKFGVVVLPIAAEVIEEIELDSLSIAEGDEEILLLSHDSTLQDLSTNQLIQEELRLEGSASLKLSRTMISLQRGIFLKDDAILILDGSSLMGDFYYDNDFAIELEDRAKLVLINSSVKSSDEHSFYISAADESTIVVRNTMVENSTVSLADRSSLRGDLSRLSVECDRSFSGDLSLARSNISLRFYIDRGGENVYLPSQALFTRYSREAAFSLRLADTVVQNLELCIPYGAAAAIYGGANLSLCFIFDDEEPVELRDIYPGYKQSLRYTAGRSTVHLADSVLAGVSIVAEGNAKLSLHHSALDRIESYDDAEVQAYTIKAEETFSRDYSAIALYTSTVTGMSTICDFSSLFLEESTLQAHRFHNRTWDFYVYVDGKKSY